MSVLNHVTLKKNWVHISLGSLSPFLVPGEIVLYKLFRILPLDYCYDYLLDFRSYDDSTLLTFFLTCNVNLVVFDHSLVFWEVCLKKWTKIWNKVLNCMEEMYRTRATEVKFEVSHDSSDCVMLFITGVGILKVSCNFVPLDLQRFAYLWQ